MTESIQVMIVGTSGIICGCVANQLARVKGLHVAYLCRSLERAAAAIVRESPDVLLLDHYQDGPAVYRLTARLTKRNPDFKVLVLGVEDYSQVTRITLVGGRWGWVELEESLAELPGKIEEVGEGGCAVPDQDGHQRMVRRTALLRPRPALSKNERKALELVFEGEVDKDIARKLKLSLGETKRTIRSALRKLGAVDRHQAARMAVVEGLIEPGRKKDTAKDPAPQDQGDPGTPPDEAAA